MRRRAEAASREVDEDNAFLDYVTSMPASYREAFTAAEMRVHAAVVARRGASATRVERWSAAHEEPVAICVVAEDRPGLLAQISAALVAHDIEVVTAYAFCRPRGEAGTEAVDFLWVRREQRDGAISAPIGDREVAAIGELVDALVRGGASFDEGVRLARAVRSARAETRVRFEGVGPDGVTLLTVEAVDRPGLLLAITKTLFLAGLQIVDLRATTEDGRAVDRFGVTEIGGRPLGPERLFALQTAILSAIEEPQG